jgi:hypothetical protein
MPSIPTHCIEFDRSRWPLVVSRFHGKTPAQEVERHLERFSEVITSRMRYASLIDLREGEATDKSNWVLYAEWFKKHKAAIERLCLGSAIVVSPKMRASLSAVMWMHPIPGPFAIFADIPSAEAWLRQQLREANMTYPPAPSESYVSSTMV